jgi:hypothetical protein
MRVALISFCPAKDEKASNIIKKLAAASTAQGNQVEIINGNEDLVNTRLTAFDYISTVVSAKGLFGGKIAPRVAEFLATSGSVSGKKGCALVIKGGLGAEKTCRNLMKAMEHEGLKLDYFDIINDADHATAVGKKLG